MASTPSLTVGAVLEFATLLPGLDLEVLGGRGGLDRLVTTAAMQKTGLAIAGFEHYLRPGRLLIFGQSEVSYLAGLDGAARTLVVQRILQYPEDCRMSSGMRLIMKYCQFVPLIFVTQKESIG